MAEPEVKPHCDDDDDVDANYKPPASKTLDDIIKTDEDDESLKKYKATLLGQAQAGDVIIIDESNPDKAIIKKMALIAEGRDDVELDLSGDITKLKESPFAIKEGCQYKIRIYFNVQRDIVAGLRYVQKTYRKGLQVDKTKYMVGSYGPNKELQFYTTPLEDAPSGMMARGSYKVKSLFTDDDGHKYLEWEWKLDIKKDWE